MKIAPVVEVKAKFSAYIQGCREEPVIVTRNGKPVAALLPIADGDELERIILAYSPRLREILKRAKEQVRRGEVLKHNDFWSGIEGGYEEGHTEGGTSSLPIIESMVQGESVTHRGNVLVSGTS